MTKCEKYGKDNERCYSHSLSFVVMMSTVVEDIPARQSFLRAILPYLVIAFLLYVIRYILKHKK